MSSEEEEEEDVETTQEGQDVANLYAMIRDKLKTRKAAREKKTAADQKALLKQAEKELQVLEKSIDIKRKKLETQFDIQVKPIVERRNLCIHALNEKRKNLQQFNHECKHLLPKLLERSQIGHRQSQEMKESYTSYLNSNLANLEIFARNTNPQGNE